MAKTIKVLMCVDVPEDKTDEFKRLVSHHIDHSVDCETNKDLISCIHSVHSYEENDFDNQLRVLDIVSGDMYETAIHNSSMPTKQRIVCCMNGPIHACAIECLHVEDPDINSNDWAGESEE